MRILIVKKYDLKSVFPDREKVLVDLEIYGHKKRATIKNHEALIRGGEGIII